MKHLFASLLAIAAISSAAQAATCRYDITMALTSLTMPLLYGAGFEVPETEIPGLECGMFSDDDYTTCEGTAYFTENRFGIDFLDIYEPTISGSLLLDPNHDPYDSNTSRSRYETLVLSFSDGAPAVATRIDRRANSNDTVSFNQAIADWLQKHFQPSEVVTCPTCPHL